MGKLIIMDDASALSDKFDAFVSFYNCYKKVQIQLCLYLCVYNCSYSACI